MRGHGPRWPASTPLRGGAPVCGCFPAADAAARRAAPHPERRAPASAATRPPDNGARNDSSAQIRRNAVWGQGNGAVAVTVWPGAPKSDGLHGWDARQRSFDGQWSRCWSDAARRALARAARRSRFARGGGSSRLLRPAPAAQPAAAAPPWTLGNPSWRLWVGTLPRGGGEGQPAPCGGRVQVKGFGLTVAGCTPAADTDPRGRAPQPCGAPSPRRRAAGGARRAADRPSGASVTAARAAGRRWRRPRRARLPAPLFLQPAGDRPLSPSRPPQSPNARFGGRSHVPTGSSCSQPTLVRCPQPHPKAARRKTAYSDQGRRGQAARRRLRSGPPAPRAATHGGHRPGPSGAAAGGGGGGLRGAQPRLGAPRRRRGAVPARGRPDALDGGLGSRGLAAARPPTRTCHRPAA
jgi:hypothetical protein